MFRLLLLAVVFVIPKTTFANDCPTKEDVKDGVVLERSGDVFLSGFRAPRPGIIEELRLDEKYDQVRGIRTEYLQGVVATRRIAPGSDIEIALHSLPTQIVPSEVGDEAKLEGTISEGGQVRAPIVVSIRNVGSEVVSIGSCSYRTIVIEQISNIADGEIFIAFRQYYSIDLGLIIRAEKLDGPISRKPVNEVKYDRIFRRMLGSPT